VELDLALTSEREAKMKNGRREAMSCRERTWFMCCFVFHFISLLASRPREREREMTMMMGREGDRQGV